MFVSNARNTAFSALALLLGASAPNMAFAETFALNEGEVSCIGFQEKTLECLSIQRGQNLPDGRIALADETHFTVDGEDFSIASGYVVKEQDDMFCVDEKTVRVRPEPLSSPKAREMAIDTAVTLRLLAKDGLCFQHSEAGDGLVAEFFSDGEKIESLTKEFRLFTASDPEVSQLRARRIGLAQYAALGLTKPGLGAERAGFVELRKYRDGHFYAPALVDGSPVRFLVDTGATTTLLTRRDAQAVGIRLDELDYNRTASTAGGQIAFAEVVLDEVRVGGVRVFNVIAAVTERDDLSDSLLGMSFLGKLQSYQFADGVLNLNE